MIWNRFSIKLFVYLILLSLLGFGFYWSIYSSQLIITNIVFLFFFLISFFLLLNYLNKTNRDLNQFLHSIQFMDNVPSNTSSELSQQQLNLTYHRIIDQIKDAWATKESEHQYFKYVLEEIGIGIITYDDLGNVDLFNRAAKKLFGIERLDNVEKLNSLKINLLDELNSLNSGSTKLIKFSGKVENIKILVRAVDLIIENKKIRLISFQNIKTQLEQSELEAWQKLIRVLTHEIMNSVTPIKSLTYSMQKSLMDSDSKESEQILKGLAAIENRSRGLLEFVESYKNLTQIPKPNYERLQIEKLFQEIENLFKKDLERKKISLFTEIDPKSISIIADGKLLMQVLINLVRNSVSALETAENKKIKLSAEIINDSKTCIKVYDNGKGISDEVIDKIFVPFYTTRIGGSGIGLSFARQVIVMHNGTIEVESKEGAYTEFIINI